MLTGPPPLLTHFEHFASSDVSRYNELALHYSWHLELSSLAYILVYYLQTIRNYKLFQVFTLSLLSILRRDAAFYQFAMIPRS